tara:strand:- start:575 stop:1213 length:639 start_codon:yes stop_codon:yes gene_type:complete
MKKEETKKYLDNKRSYNITPKKESPVSVRGSVMDVDIDLSKVEGLYREMKVHRMKRNYQHKLIRGLKLERDRYSDEVKAYVSQISELKNKRDSENLMAQEFKTLRNTALTNRDRASKNNNEADFKRFEAEQNQYHQDMVCKTEEAQRHQVKIDEISVFYTKANQACDAKHKEMMRIREKSQIFHQDLTECIEQIETLKAKYDIDYVEFGEEE